MEIFIYLLIISLALIHRGKSILKSSFKEKIYVKNKIIDNYMRYTDSEIFADIQITFGKLMLIPSIAGILFSKLLGIIVLVMICIIMCAYIVSFLIGIYKFYKNKEYKRRLSVKQLNYIIILEIILIIVVGIYMFGIMNQQSAVFTQVDTSEDKGTKIFTYELIDLPTDKSYKLEFDMRSYDIDNINTKPKYEKHIGRSNVYYSQGQENPRVIFKIDEKNNCSIDVIGMDENKQKVEDNYKFEFKRVKNELSDIIGGEVEIPYNSKGEIREKESNMGIYGSENNDESTSVRINISSN